ncbi:hypothetical protein AB9D06_04005 [Enterobacter cloacae]|uniref:hypothetical protein n=1 Tax=Enterobacter cloacae complex TaxID=354276 RepID=UPI0010556F96|nr:hypothetical protein [Enterobacter cloacae]
MNFKTKTAKALVELVKALNEEHPNVSELILKEGDKFYPLLRRGVALESISGVEVFKSLSVSALSAGSICQACMGKGRI